jgi:hypothetical protein
VPKTVSPNTDGEIPGQSARLTRSAIFDMLSNARRRYVLLYLQERAAASIRELSRTLAAWENDVDEAAVSSKQRKRVYTALHQTHLPRLDEYGVVAYDRDRGEVRATERLDVFGPYLDDASAEPNWPRYYLGIGLATVLWAVGLLFEVPVLAALDPVIGAMAVGTVLLVVAGVHATRGAVPGLPVLRPLDKSENALADD